MGIIQRLIVDLRKVEGQLLTRVSEGKSGEYDDKIATAQYLGTYG